MNKEISDKYIEKIRNCTWKMDDNDADVLICKFLDEIGYSELADAYRDAIKWFII